MRFEVIDTEWEHIVFIKDEKSPDSVFGFMRAHPGICASAKDIIEVKEKIDRIFKIDRKRMGL